MHKTARSLTGLNATAKLWNGQIRELFSYPTGDCPCRLHSNTRWNAIATCSGDGNDCALSPWTTDARTRSARLKPRTRSASAFSRAILCTPSFLWSPSCGHPPFHALILIKVLRSYWCCLVGWGRLWATLSRYACSLLVGPLIPRKRLTIVHFCDGHHRLW